MKPGRIALGIDVILEEPPDILAKARFALLANQASVDGQLRHTKNLLFQRFPRNFVRLFSPQHGFRGEKQDNMVVSRDYTDRALGIPVVSLYGESTEPSTELLEDLDVLIIDLQDVGTRVYTFIHTTALAMKACKEAGVEVIILDRPNPIGGFMVEGNVLKPEMASFVGLYPIPMRHGMTMGEMARMCNQHFGIHAPLRVVPMRGWERLMQFPETGLIFVPPSPNMPLWETTQVYPGQVIWEGTNVSEGRGTTRPFEWFGAPFIDPLELKEAFLKRKLEGLILRDIAFEPTFHKWQGRICHGFHIHVVEPMLYEPYFTSLCLLQDIIKLYRPELAWKNPPYEYEYHRLPIDLIIGDPVIRQKIEAGEDLETIRDGWIKGLKEFLEIREAYLLY
jgi:uncharacterized protein YbbC (DUF1343 family)